MHVLHVHALLREFFDVLSVIGHRGSLFCFYVMLKKEASSEASFIFFTERTSLMKTIASIFVETNLTKQRM